MTLTCLQNLLNLKDMNEKHELLKAAGFSDEFIHHILNTDFRLPNFLVPAPDSYNIIFKSTDTTELSIQNDVINASATVSISSGA
jgi:hypothetical protein